VWYAAMYYSSERKETKFTILLTGPDAEHIFNLY
jgi:hypothetical protein